MNKTKNIAIIGASNNPTKFGNIIIHNLLDKGFNIYPINPKEDLIEDLKVYKTIVDLPKIGNDVILVFVVPPILGIKIVRNAIKSGFRNFYFQPGARSIEIEQYIDETNSDILSINYTNSCIMVDTNSDDGKNGFEF